MAESFADFIRVNASGLGSKAAATVGSILDYLEIRLKLFVLEAQEARSGILRKVILLVVGGFFLLIGWLGFCTALVGFLVIKLEWIWPVTSLAVAGGHLLVGIILLLIGKRKLPTPPFEDSVREFQRDKEWLHSHRNSDKS